MILIPKPTRRKLPILLEKINPFEALFYWFLFSYLNEEFQLNDLIENHMCLFSEDMERMWLNFQRLKIVEKVDNTSETYYLQVWKPPVINKPKREWDPRINSFLTCFPIPEQNRNQLYNNTRERQAIEDLLDKLGEKRLRYLIEAFIQITNRMTPEERKDLDLIYIPKPSYLRDHIDLYKKKIESKQAKKFLLGLPEVQELLKKINEK